MCSPCCKGVVLQNHGLCAIPRVVGRLKVFEVFSPIVDLEL